MKKGFVIFIRIVLVSMFVVAITLLCLPYIAHNYIEKNSEELLGRKLTMQKLGLNYATYSLTVDNFVLYEENKVDTFLTFKHFKVNMQPWRLLKNEYAVKELLLDSFYVYVDYDGKAFNFDDLITSEVDSMAVEPNGNEHNEEIRFSLEDIQIRNGQCDLHDKLIDKTFTINNLNLSLPLLAWEDKLSEMGIAFNFGDGGNLKIDVKLDREAQEYWINTDVDSMQLEPFSPYLNSYINSSHIEGRLSQSSTIHGSLIDFEDIAISGKGEVQNLLLGDLDNNPVIKAESTRLLIDSFNVKNNYYDIREIRVFTPTIYIEKFDSSDNLSQLFAPLVEDIPEEAMDSVKPEGEEVAIRYFIDSLVVQNGELFMVDHSLHREFNYVLSSIESCISTIEYDAEKIPVSFSMLLNNKGVLNGEAFFSIKDPYSFGFSSSLKKLDLTSFSPYSEYYIARPIIQGSMSFSGGITMTCDKFKAENDIFIRELELGKKTDDNIEIKAPVKLALYILKDKDDNIKMNVPMWGDPADPDFNMGKIVRQTLSKLLVKVASEPFSAMGNLLGANPERLKQLQFEMTQDTLVAKNREILDKLAEIIEKKKGLTFTLTQETPSGAEMKALAVKQICTDYLFQTAQPSSLADSILLALQWPQVDKRDSSFVNYVATFWEQSDSLNFEQQCVAIVGNADLQKQFAALVEKRNAVVEDYLLQTLQVDSSLFEINTTDLLNHRAQYDKPIFRIELSVK